MESSHIFCSITKHSSVLTKIGKNNSTTCSIKVPKPSLSDSSASPSLSPFSNSLSRANVTFHTYIHTAAGKPPLIHAPTRKEIPPYCRLGATSTRDPGCASNKAQHPAGFPRPLQSRDLQTSSESTPYGCGRIGTLAEGSCRTQDTRGRATAHAGYHLHLPSLRSLSVQEPLHPFLADVGRLGVL